MDLRAVSPGTESLQPAVAAAHHRLPRSSGQIHLRRWRAAAAEPSIPSSRAAASSPAGAVKNSVLARGVKVHAGADVEDSIILDNCDIGRRAKVRRAILDKNVRIPEDATVGYDLERRVSFITSPKAASSWSKAIAPTSISRPW